MLNQDSLLTRIRWKVRSKWQIVISALRCVRFKVSCWYQGIELVMGEGVQFYHPVRVFGAGGKITIGDNVSFAFDGGAYWLGPVGIEMRKPEAELILGDKVTLMREVRIVCFKKITMGPGCALGDGCLVIDSNGHDFTPGCWDIPDPGAPITFGSHVHVGPDVTILKGVTIGDETTISNRSVVAGNLPARCIAMGNPARVMHQYPADKAAAPKPAA